MGVNVGVGDGRGHVLVLPLTSLWNIYTLGATQIEHGICCFWLFSPWYLNQEEYNSTRVFQPFNPLGFEFQLLC